MEKDWSRKQIWVRKSVMQGKDINNPHIHGTSWEPSKLSTCVGVYLKFYLTIRKKKGKGVGFLLLFLPMIGALVPTLLE